MSNKLVELFAKCEFDTPISESSVIIYNCDSGSYKIRETNAFKPVNLPKVKKWLKENTKLSDPRKVNGEKCWTIVFFGTRTSARSVLSSIDDDPIPSTSQESKSTSHQASPIMTSSTIRNSRNGNIQPETNIIALLKHLKTGQEKLSDSIQLIMDENQDINSKLDQLLDSKEGKKKITFNEANDIILHCTKEVAKARLDKSFGERLKKIHWNTFGLTKEQQHNLENELRWERKVTRMVANIAKILYGDLLLSHLLGRYGKRERSARESERPHVFDLNQEEKLREILRVFGDLFISEKVWKLVVQYYVNQAGRDYKATKISKRKKKRSYETETESEDSYTPSKKKPNNSVDGDGKRQGELTLVLDGLNDAIIDENAETEEDLVLTQTETLSKDDFGDDRE